MDWNALDTELEQEKEKLATYKVTKLWEQKFSKYANKHGVTEALNLFIEQEGEYVKPIIEKLTTKNSKVKTAGKIYNPQKQAELINEGLDRKTKFLPFINIEDYI
jgi:hypothetical protein